MIYQLFASFSNSHENIGDKKKESLIHEWLTHAILTFGFAGIAHNLFSQCIDK